MKKSLPALILTLLLIGGGLYFFSQSKKNIAPGSISNTSSTNSASQDQENGIQSPITTIAENLDTPWAIAFLPDGSMLVTERPGRVRLVDSSGHLDSTPIATLTMVKEIGEGGLLGLTLHPDFSQNNYVYLYYTYSSTGNNTLNRVVRMTYKDKKLSDERVIVDSIPGASNHDGGRIKFGPDKYLYITTGDAENPSQAQNTNTLGGKILRVTDTGSPAPGNPFNNLVFSYGHRNPQGLAWDVSGNLWETEHGRSSPTGYDEINLIQSGKNYGWPTIQGDMTREGMQTPIRNSGATTTWAPAGAVFISNTLFFGGLKGQSLYQATIMDNKITGFTEHFTNGFGRIREVVLGPDGMLYITTSNRDGRGTSKSGDDKIIKINPASLTVTN